MEKIYKAETNRYNTIALGGPANYDGYYETNPVARAKLIASMLKSAGIKDFVNIGVGFCELEKRTKNISSTAVDISQEFLYIAKKVKPNVLCIKEEAENLPFKYGIIQCIVADSVFQSVVDRKKFLSEIIRVVRPGGSLILSIAYKWHYPRKDQDGFNINIPGERRNLMRLINKHFSTDIFYWNSNTGKSVRTKDEGNYFWIIGVKK